MNDAAFVVLIADADNPEVTKTRICRSAEEAKSHLEAQIEAGVEQSRMRVFASTEMPIRVRLQPVVTISAEGVPDSATDGQKEAAASLSSMFRRA